MLSNHLQNGIESDNLIWSRVPESDDAASTDGVELLNSRRDGGGVDSLDYEVIENYAYREEQVLLLLLSFSSPLFLVLRMMLIYLGRRIEVSFTSATTLPSNGSSLCSSGSVLLLFSLRFVDFVSVHESDP